jgi:hypothetical protein
MLELKGAILGLVKGGVLLVAGTYLLVKGIGEPVFVGHTNVYFFWGNLPLLVGVILMIAGIATIGGVISIGIRNWEGGKEEPPDD